LPDHNRYGRGNLLLPVRSFSTSRIQSLQSYYQITLAEAKPKAIRRETEQAFRFAGATQNYFDGSGD
jgi:hypothetical protein